MAARQPTILVCLSRAKVRSAAHQDWTAWQFDRPHRRNGLVILLRRPGSTRKSIKLALHHLQVNARYEVKIHQTYEHAVRKEMSGVALASLQIRLRYAPDSCLVFYRRQKGKRQ
jgi:hypothetical protein